MFKLEQCVLYLAFLYVCIASIEKKLPPACLQSQPFLCLHVLLGQASHAGSDLSCLSCSGTLVLSVCRWYWPRFCFRSCLGEAVSIWQLPSLGLVCGWFCQLFFSGPCSLFEHCLFVIDCFQCNSQQ